MIRGMQINEKVPVHGRVHVRHVALRNGKQVPVESVITPALRKRLADKGIAVESLTNNLVVNVGRMKLAYLLRGATSAYVNRVQLGDCQVSGVVRKTDFPPDLSDVHLVHEIANIAGVPAATFDLDSDSTPDEVTKWDASVGTPGLLTAGSTSLLTDETGVDFVAEGVDVKDTVTVLLGGEDFTLGVVEVQSATALVVANPSQLAGAVGYRVQTPGTEALFRKLISGDNFPAANFGPVTIVHEAGLLFNDDALFNRITFQQSDNALGLVLQPTDIDGTRIDVQLDWLITF